MYLGAYHFDGDPGALMAAYRRLMAALPSDQIDVHLCVATERGLTVLDSCPSREVFTGFSNSPELAEYIAAAGLPMPRVEPLGEILHTAVSAEVPL